MSAESLSRRTFGDITFQGVNITKSLRPYFLSLCYTDTEDGEGTTCKSASRTGRGSGERR